MNLDRFFRDSRNIDRWHARFEALFTELCIHWICGPRPKPKKGTRTCPPRPSRSL